MSTFTPCPKDLNFRSPALRKVMEKAPYCMRCGVVNTGGIIVGCHSNRIEDGKGKGIKAHDLVAACCSNCNAYFDGPGDKEVRHLEWLLALQRTFLWLLRSGHLVVMP